MNTYTVFCQECRRRGAIGIFYAVNIETTAETPEAAEFEFRFHYECISHIEVKEVSQ